MKRFLTVLAALTMTGITVNAQSYSGSTEYNKTPQPAAIAELPYGAGMVEDAIKYKMEKMGFSGKETKGFRTYKSIKVPEISAEPVDLLFKVERKSRRDKDASFVYMLVSKGNDRFLSDTLDAVTFTNAKTYLGNVRNSVEAYSLELDITAQEDAVKKADKKYNSLIDDGLDLEKRKRKIEQDIEENKVNQQKQKDEAEKQRQMLLTLKAKRKS
jgi:hypothetical protein